MKKMYEILQALIKEPPQFKPNLLVIKCPEFLVNAFLGKYDDAPLETETCYGTAQAATARHSVIITNR